MTSPESPAAAELPTRRATAPFVLVSTAVFLLELAAFGALGYVGWQLGSGIGRLFLVFAAPVAAIVLWALFVAPKAVVALPRRLRLTVELLVYAAAVVGLFVAGAVLAGVVLGVLVAAYQLARPALQHRGLKE